jgi:hypothetical protein
MSFSVAYDDDEFELELESNTLSEGWPAPAAPLSKRASCMSVLEALSEPIADLPVASGSSNDMKSSSSSSSSSSNSIDQLETAAPVDAVASHAWALDEQLASDHPKTKTASLESGIEDAVVRVLMGEAIDWAEHQRAKAHYQQQQKQKLSAQTRLCALPDSIQQHDAKPNKQTYVSTTASAAFPAGMFERLTSLKCHDVVMPLRDIAAARHAACADEAERSSRHNSSNHVAESVAQSLARAQAEADNSALAERFRVQYLAVMSEIARAGTASHTQSESTSSSSQHSSSTDSTAAAVVDGEAVASKDAALKLALMESLREMLTDQRIISLIQTATLAKFAAARTAAQTAAASATTSEPLQTQHSQQ